MLASAHTTDEDGFVRVYMYFLFHVWRVEHPVISPFGLCRYNNAAGWRQNSVVVICRSSAICTHETRRYSMFLSWMFLSDLLYNCLTSERKQAYFQL